MTSVPSATTWGSPASTKHALLIHGLASSSHTWHRVASSLATQGTIQSQYSSPKYSTLSGYFVTAANLVGHGFRVSTEYRVSSIAEDLRPYLKARNYSLIIGHALGALTALALFAYLPPSYPIAITLVDPPMQLSSEKTSFYNNILSDRCTNPKHAETYGVENPLWKREDVISRELGPRLCSVNTVQAIFEVMRSCCSVCWFAHVAVFLSTAKPVVGFSRLS